MPARRFPLPRFFFPSSATSSTHRHHCLRPPGADVMLLQPFPRRPALLKASSHHPPHGFLQGYASAPPSHRRASLWPWLLRGALESSSCARHYEERSSPSSQFLPPAIGLEREAKQVSLLLQVNRTQEGYKIAEPLTKPIPCLA